MIIIVFLIILQTLNTESARNEIVGEPFVSCAADAIYAKWKTSKTFGDGRVRVRDVPASIVAGTRAPCYQTLITNNQIELLIPHLDCRLSRLRTLDPPGLLIETTVLISFRGDFVSKDDRIFTLRCLHSNTPKKLDNGTMILTKPLETDQNQKENLDHDRNLTKLKSRCFYNIWLEDGKHGSWHPIKPGQYIPIGVPLHHEWICSASEKNEDPHLCLLVTNCVLHDDEGVERRLIDALGCSLVPDLVPQLDYVKPTRVTQKIAAFATNEPATIRFQCQLSLVNSIEKRENFSSSVSTCPVPQCATESGLRKRDASEIRRALALPGTRVLDALSRRIQLTFFNPDDEDDTTINASSTVAASQMAFNKLASGYCVSPIVVATLIILCVGMVSTITVAILRLKIVRERFYQAMSRA